MAVIAKVGLSRHPDAQKAGSAAAVIIFDCVSRLSLLGDAAGAEIERIRNVIGNETPYIGFFSWGEVAAPPGLALAALHNKAVVVCALAQG